MSTPLAHTRRLAPVEAIAANAATFVRGAKLPADAGTPEALAAAGTYVATVTIWGLKGARI